jgi:hypothetical protein
MKFVSVEVEGLPVVTELVEVAVATETVTVTVVGRAVVAVAVQVGLGSENLWLQKL